MHSAQHGSNAIIARTSTITISSTSTIPTTTTSATETGSKESVTDGGASLAAIAPVESGPPAETPAMNPHQPDNLVEPEPELEQQQQQQQQQRRHLINPLGLYLLHSPSRGRGVFTSKEMPAGSLLEESPVLLLNREEWQNGKMDDCVLGEYGFCWSNGGMAIGLGLASLFNHSSKPNVNYIRDTKSGTITFTTCRRVHVDEELCICYSADESKLWFSPSHAGPNGTGPSSHDAHNAASLTTPLNAVNSRHSVGSADSFDGVASGLENHGIQSEEGVVLPHVDPELFEAEDQKDRDARREVRRLRLEEEHAAAMFRRQQRMAEYRGSDGRPGPRMDASNSGDPTNAGGPSGSSGSSASSALTNPSSTNQPNGILSPQPIPFTIISPALPASYSTPTLSAISDLPPPLHSSPTPSPNTPPDSGGTADLTPDLGWHEGDWYDANGEKKEVESQEEWGLLERIKGFGEDVEDSSLTIQVWAVVVEDAQTIREVLNFSKEMRFGETALKHIKRVARRPNPDDSEQTCIALCTVDHLDLNTLSNALSSFHPSLSALTPLARPVPACPARTSLQMKEKALVWPVSYSPTQTQPTSSISWTSARKAWVKAGIDRIISLALSAKSSGEYPVGVYCLSPPTPFWPNGDGFIPPTPGLRACSTDTRVAAVHPLRHAILNCVRSIAHLRTIPPFSTLQPTRNGADYLLTSLTLFITHEPCVMCCMALLHSRVREVFYIFPRKEGGGGFESCLGIHGRKDLNHRFEVWKWTGHLEDEVKQALMFDPHVAV